MVELKVRKFGNSLGVVLPKEVISRLLALHGGAEGLRDGGLLQSALARLQQRYAYDEAADIIDMAVAYAAGIVRNHPFPGRQ